MEEEAKQFAEIDMSARVGRRSSCLVDIEREKTAIGRDSRAKACAWVTEKCCSVKQKQEGKMAGEVVELANTHFKVN